MEENVFMTGGKTLTLEDYLQYDAGSRDNLGEELPVMVYRLLEYSLKEELIGQFGKEKQIEIFRNAGRKAGEYFAKKMLNLDQPLDQFVSELQSKMQELKIGVLRIEKVDEESGKISPHPKEFSWIRSRSSLVLTKLAAAYRRLWYIH